MRRVLLILVATFILISCGSGNEKKTNSTNVSPDNSVETAEIASVLTADPSTVYVYYFHGKQRCKTCVAVQNYAKEAIELMYGDNKKCTVSRSFNR